MIRLAYRPGSKYARYNAVSLTQTYPDRETAEAARAWIVATCGDRGDIDVIDDEREG